MSEQKGLTVQARAWAAYVAREVKTLPPDNPNGYFLVGHTLLDKDGFNKINDGDHDVVHGVQVIYGPFGSIQDMHNFVSEYRDMWPGDNDWRYVRPGTPMLLSSYMEPSMTDVVHNSSLAFQGQLAVNEQKRRQKEMEDVIARTKALESTSTTNPTKEEIQAEIKAHKAKIEAKKTGLKQMEQFLHALETQLAQSS